MIIPPALKPGDTVGLVATARKVAKADLQPAVELLEKHGYKPFYGKSIGLEDHQFAGKDAERAADFQHQLDDPHIKAIWCVKGGYGSVRILEHLDFSAVAGQPKWLIGYSDVTVLHSAFLKSGICSIHGQMATSIENRSPGSEESLFKTLRGELPVYEWQPHQFNQFGTAQGELVGGNLSVLYSLCGSPEALDTKGKILFLEDLDEYLYHIDRMMQNLKRNGMLENLSGLIIGGMTDMNDNAIPFGQNAEEIIAKTIKDSAIPVSFNFPAGHQFQNQALIFGKNVCLNCSEEKSVLHYEQN